MGTGGGEKADKGTEETQKVSKGEKWNHLSGGGKSMLSDGMILQNI